MVARLRLRAWGKRGGAGGAGGRRNPEEGARASRRRRSGEVVGAHVLVHTHDGEGRRGNGVVCGRNAGGETKRALVELWQDPTQAMGTHVRGCTRDGQ